MGWGTGHFAQRGSKYSITDLGGIKNVYWEACKAIQSGTLEGSTGYLATQHQLLGSYEKDYGIIW